MRSFAYTLLDVFTRTPLAGNQLAVFTDAHGLSGEEMQKIAKETNLSETTFVLPREAPMEKERGIHVRIFTVSEELEFAGHPTLGTAVVLRRENAAKVELELRVGKIPVTFEDATDGGPAFGEMRQRDPEFGAVHQPADISPIGGISAEDIRTDLPIQTVSTGMAFMIVPVKSRAALERLAYNAPLAAKYLKDSDAKFIFWVCPETGGDTRLRARMFFYNGEDPATGSASGCAAAWMARYGVTTSDERVLIRQGVEMGRPSEIFVRAEKLADSAVNVRVGGHAVVIGKGEFKLP